MKLLFTFIIFICLLSCQPTAKQNEATAHIDLEHVSTPSFYDYFSRMEIIPLETNDSSLINHVTKIIHRNGQFYILDKKQNGLSHLMMKAIIYERLIKLETDQGNIRKF